MIVTESDASVFSMSAFEKNNADLDAVIATLDTERKNAQSRKTRKAEMTQPWSLFIRRMRLLTSQSWGTRVQNYLCTFYGWTTVRQTLNRGDATVEDGSYIEIKATMITTSNLAANFVQIRPYQDIAGYRMFVVDPAYKVWRFDLTKAQMAAELAAVGANAHVAQGSSDANSNREYAIRFTWLPEDEDRKRWLANYLVASSTEITPDLMPVAEYENAAAVRRRFGL